MDYKKKRYDIRIRMLPEDFEMLWEVMFLVDGMPWKEEVQKEVERFKIFIWKLHNKMIEINRR